MSKMAFERIVQAVKNKDYYVPRESRTIGGMWVVDTWKRDQVTVQLCDDGATVRIMAPGVYVIQDYNNNLEYLTGSAIDLVNIASKF